MPGIEIKGRSKIATYRHGGRVKYATGSSDKLVGGQTKIASAAAPKNKITGADFKALKRKNLKEGSDTHVTKDGRTVKKGLYYYMNKAKKEGRSKPGKGTVTDKALKQSAKTAKA